MSERPLRHELVIDAPLEVVHRFFVDPVRLAQWWPDRALLEGRNGGRLRLEFDHTGGRVDVARGEFVQVSARRLVFTWGFEGDPDLPPGASRVEITLEPLGKATRVRLEHHGLPPSRGESHDMGWRHFLARLADAAPKDQPTVAGSPK